MLPFLFLLFSTLPVHADTSVAEDKLKALYLFNFSYFVKFPEQCEQDCDEFTICSTGSFSQVTEHLNKIISGEKVDGKPIKLKVFNDYEHVYPACQILFINSNDEKHLYSIIEAVKDKPTLTVSDIKNFTAKGGMVGFDYAKNRLIPVINNDLAQQQQLKISSKLLNIAREVK
jgi:hypothetical protein